MSSLSFAASLLEWCSLSQCVVNVFRTLKSLKTLASIMFASHTVHICECGVMKKSHWTILLCDPLCNRLYIWNHNGNFRPSTQIAQQGWVLQKRQLFLQQFSLCSTICANLSLIQFLRSCQRPHPVLSTYAEILGRMLVLG